MQWSPGNSEDRKPYELAVLVVSTEITEEPRAMLSGTALDATSFAYDVGTSKDLMTVPSCP
ncbi:MAG: hypothetical protein QG671_121 [Actinomycetota bacterium]|nr:hypothetical protein [Actinomycetota bacterium]